MNCPSCQSSNLTEFAAEMILHFSGLKNVDKPGVWVFPKVSVCLDCGSSRFATPKPNWRCWREALQQLQPHTRVRVFRCRTRPYD